jgi:proline dehydrogenase
VAIKSCLHNEKRPKIEKAFLNTKIEAYWKRIEEKFSHLDVYSYVEDQFEKAEERLCFIEIQEFVKSKLSNEDFGEHLRKYCQLEEIDHDMDLTFKFEFFMAEELCFNSLNHILKEEADEQGLC